MGRAESCCTAEAHDGAVVLEDDSDQGTGKEPSIVLEFPPAFTEDTSPK